MPRKYIYTADNVGEFEIKILLLLNTDDDYLVEVCHLALVAHEHCNSDGAPLIGPDGEVTTRSAMRAIVAERYNLLIDVD